MQGYTEHEESGKSDITKGTRKAPVTSQRYEDLWIA